MAIARQQIFNNQKLTYNNTGTVETAFSIQSVQRGYITRTPAKLQSVESQVVKRRLGGWYEKVASLGVSHLNERTVRESVTRRLSRCR
jgi:hypothetical protein